MTTDSMPLTPVPNPEVVLIRPAVPGKPKPRLLGVVDYWQPLPPTSNLGSLLQPLR